MLSFQAGVGPAAFQVPGFIRLLYPEDVSFMARREEITAIFLKKPGCPNRTALAAYCVREGWV